MAFKMKGFSPFTQTVPKNVDDYSDFPGLRKELTKDTSKREKTKPLQQKEEKKQFPSPYNPGSKFATKWGELKTPLPQKEEKKEEKKKTKDKKYEEANSEEKKILDQMDALEAKMKKIKDKNSKEYKDLENKHRDLDSKLSSYD